MNPFLLDTTGLIHFIVSVLSLVFSTLVLVKRKGTKTHKVLGYLYVLNMLGLHITAFMIYKLFDGFGLFHYGAIFSMINIMLGMIPILLKKPKRNWGSLHLTFMYWSVISLYMAFASEIFTRVIPIGFFTMVYIASAVIFIAGYFLFIRKVKTWKQLMEGFTQSYQNTL